jgi:HTH-type transcriptional regulator/antitoxin MqsA
MAHFYKGHVAVIPAVTGDYCPACEECVMDTRETDRLILAMRGFKNQIDAEIAVKD